MCMSPRPSVLVVDDFADAADALAEMLRLCGHRVAVARDAADALTAAAADPPDVVVLELGRDGIAGCELAERLRAGGCRARLIAVTACGRAEAWARARNAGVERVLLKPAEPADLLAAVNGRGAGVH